MDEKTERLRDIFMDVSEREAVTEAQESDRWAPSDTDPEERVREVIERLEERYDLRTSLPTADLLAVARGFYDGETDAAIADDLGVDRETVVRARVDLRLVTDRDLDPPFDLDDLRAAREGDRSTDEIAEELGVSPSTARRYAHVLDVQERRQVEGDRFREEFDRLLGDAELAERLTEDVQESGLEDATEGLETDVSL